MQVFKRVIKSAVAYSAFGWLAACTTTPQPAVPRVASAVKITPAAALPAVQPGVVEPTTGAPVYPLIDDRVAEPARAALLAGEPLREFEYGGASWYGPGFHGRRTASGERYDMNAMTAAHRTLPFGTWVRVRSLVNGREVDVRITDRGPFIRSRVIDVSRGAAEALGMLGLGFKEVVLFVPESTAGVAGLPLAKRRRVVKRVSKDR